MNRSVVNAGLLSLTFSACSSSSRTATPDSGVHDAAIDGPETL
jgi:hypothetical protein